MDDDLMYDITSEEQYDDDQSEIKRKIKIRGRYKCDKCDKRYTTKGNLRRHHTYECNVEPKFNCPSCNAKFTYNFHLNRHMNNFNHGKCRQFNSI